MCDCVSAQGAGARTIVKRCVKHCLQNSGLLTSSHTCSVSLLNWQEQLELRRQLFLGVQLVREVDAPDAAVGVDLNPQGLDVVGSCIDLPSDPCQYLQAPDNGTMLRRRLQARTVRSSREVRKVELDLIPAIIQTHRHGTNEWLHSGG